METTVNAHLGSANNASKTNGVKAAITVSLVQSLTPSRHKTNCRTSTQQNPHYLSPQMRMFTLKSRDVIRTQTCVDEAVATCCVHERAAAACVVDEVVLVEHQVQVLGRLRQEEGLHAVVEEVVLHVLHLKQSAAALCVHKHLNVKCLVSVILTVA